MHFGPATRRASIPHSTTTFSMAPSTPSPPPRTPKKHHSPYKRARIIALLEAGWSQRRVARREGISPGTISGIVSRYRVQKSAGSFQCSGRLQIFIERDIRHLIRFIGQDLSIKSEELKEKTGLACILYIIRREFIWQDIQHYTALRRPKLTDQLTVKRLTFARLYMRKPFAYWQRVVFSDESTVARGEKKR